MKAFLLATSAAAILGFAGTALAQAQSPGPMKARTHARADVAAKVQNQFTRADANRDGAITQDEAQALAQALRPRPAMRQGMRTGGMGGPGNGEGFFTRFDANKDGNVTRAEFDAVRAARAQQQEQRQGERRAGMFARLDSNKDNAVSRAEFDAMRQQSGQGTGQGGPARGPGARGMAGAGRHLFTMADANKDGRVTLPEAQAAALKHFDMADANKDGQVTREERQQMRQQMRAHMGHQG